jgi:hypothetical protein
MWRAPSAALAALTITLRSRALLALGIPQPVHSVRVLHADAVSVLGVVVAAVTVTPELRPCPRER